MCALQQYYSTVIYIDTCVYIHTLVGVELYGGDCMTMALYSWKVTVVTQICLCLAALLALNIGQPSFRLERFEKNHFDFYFISVGGGFRPPKQQSQLLSLMAKVTKLYNAQFVVNLSSLGEDDPLLLNATHHLQSLQVPWYTTGVLNRKGLDYLIKQIEIPHQKVLDVIIYRDELLQDTSAGSIKDRFNQLRRPLQASNGDWCIVVGFQSLESCDDIPDKLDLYHEFLKYGVDAYLSAQSCTNNVQKEDMPHIHDRNERNRGPYFTSINEKRVLHGDVENGFLLHRVGPLEIVTYLVTLKGEVVHQTTLRQVGRHVM